MCLAVHATVCAACITARSVHGLFAIHDKPMLQHQKALCGCIVYRQVLIEFVTLRFQPYFNLVVLVLYKGLKIAQTFRLHQLVKIVHILAACRACMDEQAGSCAGD